MVGDYNPKTDTVTFYPLVPRNYWRKVSHHYLLTYFCSFFYDSKQVWQWDKCFQLPKAQLLKRYRRDGPASDEREDGYDLPFLCSQLATHLWEQSDEFDNGTGGPKYGFLDTDEVLRFPPVVICDEDTDDEGEYDKAGSQDIVDNEEANTIYEAENLSSCRTLYKEADNESDEEADKVDRELINDIVAGFVNAAPSKQYDESGTDGVNFDPKAIFDDSKETAIYVQSGPTSRVEEMMESRTKALREISLNRNEGNKRARGLDSVSFEEDGTMSRDTPSIEDDSSTTSIIGREKRRR